MKRRRKKWGVEGEGDHTGGADEGGHTEGSRVTSDAYSFSLRLSASCFLAAVLSRLEQRK